MSLKAILMIKLLFAIASSAMNLNGQLVDIFNIKRGVRQGCPMPPYFFILVDEVFNQLVKQAIEGGKFRGSSCQMGLVTNHLLIHG
jgi:hypothetical protein